MTSATGGHADSSLQDIADAEAASDDNLVTPDNNLVNGSAPAPFTPKPRGTRLDAWWAETLTNPAVLAYWNWAGPIIIAIVAAVLRFWNLGHPQSLVFDETYYVKDAWTLMHNGYESSWPKESDDKFAAGETMIFKQDPAYVVHPPLGKWAIGLGMLFFGAADSFWWRAPTALAGVLIVILVMLITRKFFKSTLLAVIAGLLMAIDGNAIVMSRVALLDNWLALFSLLGFYFLLLDWRFTDRIMNAKFKQSPDPITVDDTGATDLYLPPRPPRHRRMFRDAVLARPWLYAAGLAFGAACAVKWSGLWFLVVFGLYLVAYDVFRRRRLFKTNNSIKGWFTEAVFKQGTITFLSLVPLAFLVYIVSWTGWLITSGGYYRNWADEAGNAATGFWAWVPKSLQSLWFYHESAYGYHVNLHSPHPWSANPLTWLFMIRPTNMYFGEEGSCGPNQTCWDSIIEVGNPFIWWASAIAVFYLLYRLVRYREGKAGFILLGIAAGYLPWLLYINRTVFQFYSIAFQPYMIIALVYVIRLILGSPNDLRWRRLRGILIVGIFLLAAIAVSAFFYPIWTATPISPSFRQIHMWLPTWG